MYSFNLIKPFLFFLLFTNTIFSTELILTQEEKTILKNKQVMTLCIDPNWMPYEKNDNGKHIGMTAEYFKIIQNKINTPVKMLPTKSWLESLEAGKKRDCDIFSLIMPTQERNTYLNFTDPYLMMPLVLATKINEIFVNEIKTVTNKKIGVVKGYAYGEILKKNYPNMQLINVESVIDGLEKVEDGTHYGFIGSLSTIGYNIQKNFFGQLKIAGKFDEKWNLGIGVRNDIPELTQILNKAINSITKEEHQNIMNKWLSVKYVNASYKYIFEISALSILIIGIILIINRKLSQEVKKRKEIEEYLNLIIKGANLGTWIWNPKTDKNIINENWANILGYTKKEIEKIEKPFFNLVLEEDKKIIQEALKLHKEGKRDIYEASFRMKAKDGSIKWIYSCGSTVQKEVNGKEKLLAGIHQDITEEKNLEEEIKNQNDYIVQQSRQAAMGEMLENIAHQWRQPLSVITTSASGVKFRKEYASLEDKELLEAMDHILKSGNYLSQTIEDFRSFFRKDRVLSEILVDDLLGKSLQFLKSKLINRNIEIVSTINDNKIYSYENELVQALINIFSNSVDALETVEEERYIFIEESSDDFYFTITIKDTAGGIDEKIIYKIFDPYFTTKHQSQGTGIGLHMTREIIVKQLKGTIKVENSIFEYKNKQYKGALFTIKIPKA